MHINNSCNNVNPSHKLQSRKLRLACLFLLTLFLTKSAGQTLQVTPVAGGFQKPVAIQISGLPDDNRLFIVEKDGKIKILNPSGAVNPVPFLDIDAKVNSLATERGLLGLAFHPDFQSNGYFFVNYINAAGNTTISRFSASTSSKDLADPSSEKIILTVNQPFNNHNAGDLAFGADGYLYIPTGDGGNAGDPGNRSQNPKDLLGKILRIDVNTTTEKYLIPSDNPFAGKTDTLPEIWALGLRNPWRFSLDKTENNWWIADVGQDKWEEINVLPATLPKVNFGWRCYEGLERFQFSGCNDARNYRKPVHVYDNRFDVGCSVTGGYVYRGSEFPFMNGQYIYADYCTGKFWSLKETSDGKWLNQELADLENQEYSAFGSDRNKELYVAGYSSGQVSKITFTAPSETNQISKNTKIVAYPNPATNALYIEYQTNNDKFQWILYSESGISIYLPSTKTAENKWTADVAHLPNGMYTLVHSQLPESATTVVIQRN
ncbi:MAG: PQQ-dependent sugar dehydrogenase [Saprospiraceae bacterium]|nr:PQQ-dependent sugar dehydrogenase [Saprospiraceae bacterium]